MRANKLAILSLALLSILALASQTRADEAPTLAKYNTWVTGVAFSPDGSLLASVGGQSLLSQWDQVVPHLAYVIGWAVTAGLVALSVARPSNAARLGARWLASASKSIASGTGCR